MNSSGVVPEGNHDSAVDALFSASLRRIERFIPILGILLAGVLGLEAGWLVALGFGVGCAVAYVNFRWLKSTVGALSDAVTQSGAGAPGGSSAGRSKPSVVLRFLTRFVLIGLAAYVIFVSYPVAFHGFLGGLFTPVLAVAGEAAYLIYGAVRRGF